MERATRAFAVAVMLCGAAIGSPRAQTTPASPQVPSNPTAADAAARANAGDFATAAAIANTVVEHNPNDARAWRVLGLATLRLKQPQRAIEALTKAYALDASVSSVIYNLGAAYAAAGDKDKAFEWLARARSSHKVDMSAAEADPDLASLKADPRFSLILPSPEDFKDPFVEPVKILREWDGEAAGDQFGWIARRLGDVDADGVPDVVTSAPTKAIGGENAGRIYVYSTKTGRELWHADGKPGDQLGTGVECAGDVNRDGIPDVIASAPGGGYAKVYSGRDGAVLLTLMPPADERARGGALQFGHHASGIGDVNHDGYDDVIVGAPGSDAGGKGAGRAYVFSGKDGSLLLTLTGAREGDAFGSAVGGYSDKTHTVVIVGAPAAGAAHHGRAFVYTTLSQTPALVVDADATGNAFGAMFVSVPGDFNGDGIPDVYISDWSNTAKGPSTGRVYVFSGADGKPLLTLTGETPGEGFGTSPSVAGDVDGDGVPDLIVGAWQYAGAAASGGRAYLYSGITGRLIKTFTCKTPGDTFGFDAVALGDIDGDGTVDFLITSGWSGIHGFHSGRVFVVSSGVAKRLAEG